MSVEETVERRATWQNQIWERLHDPKQLRAVLTLAVVAIGYLIVYQPLSRQIAFRQREMDEARRELALAQEVEQLREQYAAVVKRLPAQSDDKEFLQYVLQGIRQLPLTLNSLTCEPPRDLGAYKAVVLQVQVSGTFADLDSFVRWLEANDRLFRLDRVNISAGKNSKNTDNLTMQLVVLGLMG